MNSVNKGKFNLGQIVATPGALAALQDSNETALPFLLKHQNGDWGSEICEDDKQLNNQAISHEGDADQQQRVLSAYRTSKNEKIWIITEWDRSVTTILLPDEY
jgi:hypothetical protein